jgi:DNA-directed RNA polymerase subunit RPC12/RpoP
MKGSIIMELKESLKCPKCGGKDFVIKREATYLYTYKVNLEDMKKNDNKIPSLPFLFDSREKETSNEYIECEKCGEKYAISLDAQGKQIDFTIIQKAVRADYIENPEFLG